MFGVASGVAVEGLSLSVDEKGNPVKIRSCPAAVKENESQPKSTEVTERLKGGFWGASGRIGE